MKSCLEFDTVWSKTVVLVNSVFSRDLAEEVLQVFPPKFQRQDILQLTHR